MDYYTINAFMAGNHEVIAARMLNWYTTQATAQIEDTQEALAEAEQRAKRDVFVLAEETKALLVAGATIAISGTPSNNFMERIDKFVTDRRIMLFATMNDMLLNS